MGGSKYQVIVVGGGQAGCEAALASARIGCKTLMLIIGLDSIGLLTAGPQIGGAVEGCLVREVDALGGEIARAVENSSIHKRWSEEKEITARTPLAVVDRRQYQLRMKHVLEKQDNLELRQALATKLIRRKGQLEVVAKLQERFVGEAVVLAVGTFLGGRCFVGSEATKAGRYGELPADELEKGLVEMSFKMGRRIKDIAPRVHKSSLDLSELEVVKGESEKVPLSFWERSKGLGSRHCYITHLNRPAQTIIRQNMAKSILTRNSRLGASSQKESIEEKLACSEDKKETLFIQPEGERTQEMYISGLSTALPESVQMKLLRCLKGFEKVNIARPGYIIEHSYLLPGQTTLSLETKRIEGLFTAGQINGTSGYEEAAAQGLIAGINAALKVKGKSPLILDRSQAYIGVLIDDLVTRGVDEPYRMFTSRAEYRLLLRSDNADLRLSPIGHQLGLISDKEYEQLREKVSWGRQSEVSRET